MIYLDNSATTQCAKEALEIMQEALVESYGNPSSLHDFGMVGENYIKEARAVIADSLRCQPKEIIFTSGGTEGNNMAIRGTVGALQKSVGKHLITTAIEHASVSALYERLKKEGFEITFLPVNNEGIVDEQALKDALREDTCLVSVMLVNNEIGTVEPIERLAKIVHENSRAYFHVDAVQGYGKVPIIPKSAGVDLLSVSGHKLHGPKGSGFLYVKNGIRIVPLIYGGGQEGGMRSGTENVPAIAGLGEAVRILFEDFDAINDGIRGLRKHFEEGIAGIEGVSVNGPKDEADKAPHIVSVSVQGVRAEVLLHALESEGLYVSAGSACSSNKPAVSRTLSAIGLDKSLLDSTVRFSFCRNNTLEECDEAIAILKNVVPKLRGFVRR